LLSRNNVKVMANNLKFIPKSIFLASACSLCLIFGAGQASAQSADVDQEWVSMPEGGKTAFAGVQGGTVPATVFYTEDGTDTTTQAGLGSNDFLEAVQGESDSFTAENMVPFGFGDETEDSGNLAANGSDSLPRVLPSGVAKIYDQDSISDDLFMGNELSRM